MTTTQNAINVSDLTPGTRIMVRGGFGSGAPEVGIVVGTGSHEGRIAVDYDREAAPDDCRFAYLDQIDSIIGDGPTTTPAPSATATSNIHTAVEQEQMVMDLNNALMDGADMTNKHRAARVLIALVGIYGDDMESAIRDGLSDLRHACDLLGQEYRDQDRMAQGDYEAEVFDEREG